VELFDDLGGLLLLGFALAGLIAALAPDLSVASLAGGGAWGSLGEMALMVVVAVPIYVCATAATPLAAALIAQGVSPGAALAFLMAGPATNMASLALVAKMVGRRGAGIYLASVAGTAIAMGLLLNALYPALGMMPQAFGGEGDCSFYCGTLVAEISAALVLALCVRGALRRWALNGKPPETLAEASSG
jgi:hypothetical protein